MQSPQKFKYFYAINCWKVNPLMDTVNIVIIPNELLLFSDHYNLQVFQSLFRMVFCSKNLFLGNQNFEESQFENNKCSTRKYILGYCIQFMEKKINSNSILQNLNSRNWRHFECISERGHADDCANSKTFLQQQVGKDLPCVIESLIQVWRIDDDISFKQVVQFTHSISILQFRQENLSCMLRL